MTGIRLRALVATLLLSLAILAGCKHGGRTTPPVGPQPPGNPQPPEPPAPPAAPEITAPEELQVALGERLEFLVSAREKSGTPVVVMLEPLPLPRNTAFDVNQGRVTFEPDLQQVGENFFQAVAVGAEATARKSIRVVVSERPAGSDTLIRGIVLDSDLQTPIVGAQVYLPLFPGATSTDSEGRFSIGPVPIEAQVLAIDGLSAGNYTFVAEDIDLLLEHPIYEGQINVVHRPIYLPRLGTPSGTINPATVSTIQNAFGVVLTVAAGSARNADGTLFQGNMFMPRVAPEFTPAALPEDLAPADVFAIQPAGLNFNPPAAITLPNTNGLPNGSEVNIWSIDPVTGQFHIVGTAVAQGASLLTVTGGVRNSSWHFAESGSVEGNTDSTSDTQKDPQRSCAQAGSEVALHSGSLSEKHGVVSYQSLGVTRQVVLTYTGESSCPTPVITADVDLHQRYGAPTAFASTVLLGGLNLPGVVLHEPPPNGPRATQRIARIFNASLLPTGSYPYSLRVTSQYPASEVSARFNGRLLVHNNMTSPFGSGWTVGGLQKLKKQTDGMVVVDDGTGQLLAFSPGRGRTEFADFAELAEIQLNGTATSFSNPVLVNGVPVLRLNANGSAGSMFYTRPIALSDEGTPVSFRSEFRFRLSDPAGISDSDGPGADGLVFVIARQPSALGSGGQGIGYSGITNSVAVEFDTFNNGGGAVSEPNGNHVGINRSGSVASIASKTHPVRFNDGAEWFAWVDYDAAAEVLEVRFANTATRPANAQLSASIDLLQDIGQSEAFFGFTAGSASAVNKHDLLSWSLEWGAQQTGPEQRYTSPRGEMSRLTELADGTFERAYMDGSKARFDAAGKQLEQRDRLGNVVSYTYDSAGRLIGMADPVGLTTGFVYGADGLLDQIDVPGAAPTLFAHQGRDLVRITDPDGCIRQFQYDADHRLIRQIDPRGFETTYDYQVGSVLRSAQYVSGAETMTVTIATAAGAVMADATTATTPAPLLQTQNVEDTRLVDRRGFESRVRTDRTGGVVYRRDPLGNVTEYLRNSEGMVIEERSPRGRIDRMTYDPRGNLTSQVEAVGVANLQRTTSYQYAPGRDWVIRVVNGEGHATQFERDPSGNITRITHPDLTFRLFTYDARGQLLTSTDENGNLTLYTYDANGRLETVTDALGFRTRYAKDGRGNVVAVTEGEGTAEQRTRSFTYDAMNRILSSTDGAAGTTTYTYDARGNLLTTTMPTGEAIVRTYDARNRLSSLNDPLRGITTFTYDAEGNLLSRTDARNLTTSNAYDNGGRLASVTDAAAGIESYGYDPSGNVISFTNARQKTTTFQYDLLERRTRMTTPLGRIRQWAYDRTDNLTTETQPGNVSIVHTYNNRGWRTATNVPAVAQPLGGSVPGNAIAFTYDPVGNLRTVIDNDTRIERTYDALNRVREEKTLAGGIQPVTTLTSTYNAVGDRASLADSLGGLHTYGHDGAGRLTSVSTPEIGTIGLSYDPSGRLRVVTNPNGITGTYSYLPNGRLSQITHAPATGPALVSLSYTTGPSGNVDGINDAGVQRSYSYDAMDRLTGASDIAPASYAYDPVGNRTQSDSTSTAVYNDDNQLLSDESGTYQYDVRGNLVSFDAVGVTPAQVYRWDAQNQLVEAVSLSSYRYDGLGRRIEKMALPSMRRYAYDGDDILLEFDGSNQLLARHTSGEEVDQHIAVWRMGAAYFYHADRIGSVRSLSDSAGLQVNHYSYDAYGRPVQRVEGVENQFQFSGREDAIELGWLYYRARWYSPNVGVFTSEDPLTFLASDTNWYRYTSGNPLIYRDPTGRDVTVCYYDSATGHIGIAVHPAMTCPVGTVGFRPTEEASLLGAALGRNVPGRVSPDAGDARCVTAETNRDTDEIARRLIENRRQTPGSYNLYDRQCTSFVRDVLRGAGFDIPSDTMMPETLFESLPDAFTPMVLPTPAPAPQAQGN